jgi:GrpB-like predicted nucleotidyltransferase (UPF0157 family)
MLVEVTSLRVARTKIVPILEAQGYDYFWRPSFGDDIPPWYAFFIRRDRRGMRTHHIHMVTQRRTFREHWERLLFRDYLIAHPKIAHAYGQLKMELAAAHPNDRVAYTEAKTAFIQRISAKAKKAEVRSEPPTRKATPKAFARRSPRRAGFGQAEQAGAPRRTRLR